MEPHTLTGRQLWALDVLDSALESSAIQLRYTLKPGEIMISNDSKVLHGRTCYADYFEAVSLDGEVDNEARLCRTMDRWWVLTEDSGAAG